MIKNLKKKAFTLVELLVVIAILAILATAGIVGYTSFTKKAQVSNDNSLVAELNNYISVASVTNDYNTVSEVRDELVNSGIDLSTLTPSAKNHGYYYAFNLKEEKFVLLHDKELAEGYSLAADTKSWDVFVLVKKAEDASAFMNAGYSVYLQKDFDASSLTASKGVDVGENISITNISYSNSAAEQNVVIRTNSVATTLTINAPADTVKHFGNANVINVTAVATASYHENGSVATLNVKAGKVAVEKDAYVGKVAVASTATSDTGANQVIITNQGTIFDTEVVTYTVNENGSVETEVVESPTGDAAALVNNVTVVDPSSSTLQIGTADALINLANAQVQGLVTGELNIELTANIDLGNKSWVPFGTDKENAFQGTIDGKNHKITNLSYNPNAIIEKYVTSSGTYGAPYGLIAYATKNVTIKNLTISANIDITTQDGQGVGAFIGAYNNSSKTLDSTLYTLELNNCTSQGSISADKKVGGIVGTSFITPTGEYQYRLALATKFINCTNEANIAASGTKAGGISSGVISISAVTPGKDGGVGSFVCTNCVNKGSVIASSSYGAFSGYFSGGDCPTGFDLSSFTDTANVGNHYDCGGGVTVS